MINLETHLDDIDPDESLNDLESQIEEGAILLDEIEEACKTADIHNPGPNLLGLIDKYMALRCKP